MPDWDDTESTESGEDAAWRELIARFDAPLDADHPVPWPTREDVTAEASGTGEGADGRGLDGVPGGQPGDDGPGDHDAAGGLGPARLDGGRGRNGPADGGTAGAAGANGAAGTAGAAGANGAAGTTGAGESDGPRGPKGAGGDGGTTEYSRDDRPNAPGSGLNWLDGRGEVRGLDEPGGDGSLDGLGGGNGRAGLDGLTGSNGPAGLDGGSSLNGLGRGHGLNGLSGGHGRSRLNGERLPADQRDTRNRTAGRHGRRARGRAHDPEVIEVPRTIRKPVRDEDEHYIPPPPPPLPKLDPVAKGAWVALFGGPGYLVLATAVGWTITGLSAFLSVAAFVAGFAILVLRMHDSGPGGPHDGDDGAVV